MVFQGNTYISLNRSKNPATASLARERVLIKIYLTLRGNNAAGLNKIRPFKRLQSLYQSLLRAAHYVYPRSCGIVHLFSLSVMRWNEMTFVNDLTSNYVPLQLFSVYYIFRWVVAPPSSDGFSNNTKQKIKPHFNCCSVSDSFSSLTNGPRCLWAVYTQLVLRRRGHISRWSLVGCVTF